MQVLVMGGRRFSGLHLVEQLVRAGHEVYALNRGKSPAALPPLVRRLVADRYDLAAVKGCLAGHAFDAVFDVSASKMVPFAEAKPQDFGTAHVEGLAEALRGQVARYLFVSSTVVYAPSLVQPL